MPAAHLAVPLALAAFVWLASVGDGIASDPRPADEAEVVLRIRDAVELALPGLDRTGPELASWRVREAEGRYWPTISARARYIHENSPALVAQGSGTAPVVSPDFRIQRYDAGLTATYNFLGFLETGPRIRGAMAEERASVLRLNQLQSERVVRVVEAYLALVTDRQALAGLERLRRETQAFLTRQEARLANDQIPMIEVVRARARLLEVERDQLALSRRTASAELELRRLTGLKPELRISPLFVPEELDLSLIGSEGVSGLLDLARNGNARLLAANLAVEAAQWDARAVRARNSYPSLALFGAYGYGRDEFFTSSGTSRSQDFRYSLYLTLELPLFDGGVRRAQIAQSDVTTESRLQQAKQAAQEIKLQIEDSYHAFVELRRRRELLEREVVLAREELDQVTMRATAGLAAETEPLSVLARYVGLRRELAQATATALTRGVDLVLVVGRNPLASSTPSADPARPIPVSAAWTGPDRSAAVLDIAAAAPAAARPEGQTLAAVAPDSPRPAPASPSARDAADAPRTRARTLTDVRVADLNAVVAIALVANGPIPRVSTVALKEPTRLVVDLHGVTEVAPRLGRALDPRTPLVSQVRIGQYPDKVRVVLDLVGVQPAGAQIVERPNGLDVLLVPQR